MNQTTLFEDDLVPTRARADGPETSMAGAQDVSSRAPTHRDALLEVFRQYPSGITDEQAAAEADLLHTCYWKRCGELRRLGLIKYTDERRRGSAGVARRVSKVVQP